MLPYIKWRAGENLLCNVKNPKLVLCDDLEEWDGERDGKEA